MSLYLVENSIEPALSRVWHYGNNAADQQFRELHEVSLWNDADRRQLQDAERVAAYVHAGDMHRGWPYSFHYRTVANTIASPDGFNIQRVGLATAALLHDTIEDHPGRIIGYYNAWSRSHHLTINLPYIAMPSLIEDRRHSAGWLIGKDFGEPVAALVGQVSQPVDGYKGNNEAIKLAARLVILQNMIRTPEGCLIKVADSLSHDAGGNHPADTSPERVRYLEQKNYGSRLLLAARVEQPDVQALLPPSGREFIRTKFAAYGINMAA